MITHATLTIASYSNDEQHSIGDRFNCTVEFDPERRMWRAECRRTVSERPIKAWAGNQRAAILAVFSMLLGCEAELREALPLSGDEKENNRMLVTLLARGAG